MIYHIIDQTQLSFRLMHLYVQSVNAIHVCVPKTSIPQNVKNCSGRKFGGALRLHQSFLCKTFLLSYTQLPICLTVFYYRTRVQRKIKTYSKRRTKILRKLCPSVQGYHTSSILVAQVRKPPDIAETHSKTE